MAQSPRPRPIGESTEEISAGNMKLLNLFMAGKATLDNYSDDILIAGGQRVVTEEAACSPRAASRFPRDSLFSAIDSHAIYHCSQTRCPRRVGKLMRRSNSHPLALGFQPRRLSPFELQSSLRRPYRICSSRRWPRRAVKIFRKGIYIIRRLCTDYCWASRPFGCGDKAPH